MLQTQMSSDSDRDEIATKPGEDDQVQGQDSFLFECCSCHERFTLVEMKWSPCGHGLCKECITDFSEITGDATWGCSMCTKWVAGRDYFGIIPDAVKHKVASTASISHDLSRLAIDIAKLRGELRSELDVVQSEQRTIHSLQSEIIHTLYDRRRSPLINFQRIIELVLWVVRISVALIAYILFPFVLLAFAGFLLEFVLYLRNVLATRA